MASSSMARFLGIAAAVGLLPIPDGHAGRPPSPTDALRAVAGRTGRTFFPHANRIAAPDNDRSLAPYFHVPGDGTVDLLPLKETGADVEIAGVIARVRVKQVYENHAKSPIEAVYVFPASTRAAVHGMRMRIGKRTIEARIERRKKAREDYEQARREGRRASLLEQQRENVFSMNVANIMPGDRIEVELDYSELLVPQSAVYEFVYPTVVGPRYGGGADPDRDRWIASPYLREGKPEPYAFDIRARLHTSIPLKDVSSPSHAIDVDYDSASSATVSLTKAGGGNRDFILRYRLAGDRIETGLLLFEGDRDGTFALLMEPPRRPSEADIPAREFIFLLDVSGSMNGFPIETAKSLMQDLLVTLRPEDSFNIVLFAGASHVMSRASLPATEANVRAGLDLVHRQRGGGGTELMAGLRAAYGIEESGSATARTVVAITDGFVGVESQAFRFIREHLDDANLFAFGIGSSVNRALIEGMARAGLGEPFVVLDPQKAAPEAERFRAMIDRPVLTDVEVEIHGLDAHDVLPDKVPDLLAERPLVLLGKYRGRARGRIEIRGKTGGGRFRRSVTVDPSARRSEHEPLRWLWARRWVSTLEDELAMGHAPELEESVTKLGLDYSLLTRFTSFVAVDSEIANTSGAGSTVKQPLPLPEGVSDLAVGGAGGRAVRSKMALRRAAPNALFMNGGSVGGESFDALSGAAPAAPREEAARPPRLQVTVTSAAGLDRADALRQAVLARLRAAPCGIRGKVRMRLTVDRNGSVITAEVVGKKTRLGRCLIGRLRGLGTAARARRPHAAVEIVVALR